jgi:hypothetical protein
MTLSKSTRLSLRLHEDELRVLCLANYTTRMQYQDIEVPEATANEFQELLMKDPRNLEFANMYWDLPRETILMSEEEAATFWEQVYFFSFANFGIPVPDSMLIPLENMRITEHGSECFTSLEKEALEYFSQQVARHSPYVPVPNFVKRRLYFAARVEHETGEEEGYDVIPACNCPHCWTYMEDMARFMEHLWEKHSLADQLAEDTLDNGRNVPEKESQENANMQDKAVPSQRTEGIRYEGKAEEMQERKDSGFEVPMNDDPMPPAVDPTLSGLQRTLEQDEALADVTPPASNQSDAEEQSDEQMREVATKTRDTAAKPSSTMDVAFWKGLLMHPLQHVHGQENRTEAPGVDQGTDGDLRIGLLKRLREQEKHAQNVRNELRPITWFRPYPSQTKFASPISSPPESSTNQQPTSKRDESVFKLPTMPASQMRKQSMPRLRSSKSPEDLSPPAQQNRHWICAHDEGCKRRFDSLVLYVEHLTERGLVVFKTWREHNPTVGTKLKDLRVHSKGI